MKIIPAIDLKAGKVVRLTQGRYDETIYSDDPLKIATEWKALGAKYLHIIDLDGAVTGRPQNLNVVKNIVDETGLSVQFGGGLRDKAAIENVLGFGIEKVILGTKAEDEDFLKNCLSIFGEKILVSVDEVRGKFMKQGWKESTQLSTIDFIKRLEQNGLKTIIYTDISRDGTMKGPNLIRIKEILESTKLELIASGGIGSIDDIASLNDLKPIQPYGVIIGRALYEGRITLVEIFDRFRDSLI